MAVLYKKQRGETSLKIDFSPPLYCIKGYLQAVQAVQAQQAAAFSADPSTTFPLSLENGALKGLNLSIRGLNGFLVFFSFMITPLYLKCW